jgi:vitamin B12 transporter
MLLTLLMGLVPPLMSAPAALAQPARPVPPARPAPAVQPVEPVVVTATKVETPAERVGASVTVVTEDEIRTLNIGTVEEALRRVPGVEIQRSGGLGKTSSITIRGANANQVQVLVDGMRVKSPTLGSMDLSELSLDAIERIEIVRGPQSALHGADAIGGVVNIILKKGQGGPHGSLSVEGGSYETLRETANAQGAFGRFNFNVSASRYDTRGHLRRFDNDDAEQTAFGGRIGYDLPWGAELSLSGRYSKTSIDVPVDTTFPSTVFDPNSQQQTETWLYNLAYKQTVVDWWRLHARYGQWWNNQGFQDPPPPDPAPTISQIDTRRREFEVINAFDLAKWDTLTIGVEHRNERGRNRGTFRQEINTVSVFGHDEIRLVDRFFVVGGLRYEDNDVFGDALTPQVSASFLVKETGTKLRAAWAKGFRAPTINDLFFPGFGNVDLQPERSESYEVGADQKLFGNRLRFGVTFFHNQFEDLIQFVFDPGNNTFLPFNVGSAQSEGVETSLEVEPLDWVLVWVNYTYTDTEDVTTGLPLRRFARHRWNTGVQVTPWTRLGLFAQAHVTSSQLETAGVRNPGYHRIDVGGTYLLSGRAGRLERLELTARIENVTDESYDEVKGFRAPGFNALVGLRAYFP